MQIFQTAERITCNKDSKWKIDMQFLPVKLVHFCWFAGAFSLLAFLPVFLKHQGLTISHLSLFVGISVLLQFSVAIIIGYTSDRIGRIKPFYFISLGLNCVLCFSLTTLPRVNECMVENAIFECYKDETSFINATSCQLSQNNSREIECLEMLNGRIPVYPPNDTSEFIITLFPELDLNLEVENFNNISMMYSPVPDCTNCSFENNNLCTKNSCKPSHINCSINFVNCNKKAKFWIIIYGILVIFTLFSRTITFRIIEIIASGLAIESNADFGRQRLFGILGSTVGPPLVGFILNKINGPNTIDRSYSWVFYCVIIFSVLSAIFMGMVNPKFHKPASNIGRKSLALLKNLDIILFLALLIVMGTALGFQYTYRNWYLKELGASDLLTGIVSGSASFYGIPFMYNSKWFIDQIGYRNMFFLGLLGHAVCSFSYSLMAEPWIALMLESISIISYYLFWVAAIQYAHSVAPEGLEALVKALAGSLHFNIGKLGSSLVAGCVMKIYGGSAAFTVLGCIALAYSFVYGSYLIVLHLRQKKTGPPSKIVTKKEVDG